MGKWMGGQTDLCVDRRADGWMKGWRQMYGWTDVQMDGLIDGETDG